MNNRDVNHYIERYTKRFDAHGYSPESLGWGKVGKQDIRFKTLSAMAVTEPDSSVLDIGCGFADLFRFLRVHGWRGRYTGVDLVPALIHKAKELESSIELITGDFITLDLAQHDHVIASGIFNYQLESESNEEHIFRSVSRMFDLANKSVSVDFLTTYVDFQQEGAWHTSPEWSLKEFRKISNRLTLYADYLPFEFAVTLYKFNQRGAHGLFEKNATGDIVNLDLM